MISIQTRAQLAKTVLGTMALGNGTVLTAVTAVVNQSTAFSYMVAGKMKTKAVNATVALNAPPTVATVKSDGSTITADEATAWLTYVIPANKIAYGVLALDNAGAVVMFQGSYDDQDLAFRGRPLHKGKSVIPDIPLGFVPFAIIKFACAVAFTLGTTASNTAGVSITDIGILPAGNTL